MSKTTRGAGDPLQPRKAHTVQMEMGYETRAGSLVAAKPPDEFRPTKSISEVPEQFLRSIAVACSVVPWATSLRRDDPQPPSAK